MAHPKTPVAVRGMRFESVTACAAHFGVGIGHVVRMLDTGTIDNIGKGRNFNRRVAVMVGDKRYESIADAARVLGVSVDHMSRKTKRGPAVINGLTVRRI